MYFPTSESVINGKCGPCCSVAPATSRTVLLPDLMLSRISVQLISSISTGGFLPDVLCALAGHDMIRQKAARVNAQPPRIKSRPPSSYDDEFRPTSASTPAVV